MWGLGLRVWGLGLGLRLFMKNNATVIYEQIATVSSSSSSNRLVVGGNVFISDRLGLRSSIKMLPFGRP